MIEHIVLFKFKPETTKEQKDVAIQRLKNLGKLLPGILDIQAGYNITNRAKGFEMGLTVRFEDSAALDHYGPSPEHQAVVSFLAEIGLDDLLAFDFEI